jgi:hypothetical protein
MAERTTAQVIPMPRRRVRPLVRWRIRLRRLVGVVRARGGAAEAGMTTAEYAVGTVAACAFAALLYKVVTSGWVSAALGAVVRRALQAA